MYAFSLVELIQPTQNRVRQVRASLILMASEVMLRNRHDIAVRDTMVSSPIHGLLAERENLMALWLLFNVVATIQSPKVLSTRGLYELKWCIIEASCRQRSVSPY